MTRQRSTQTMKPATAARKLGVHPDATPDEFRAGVVSRDELNALQADPPDWLRDLRRNGPHPRQVIAAKLRISISGLTRAGITDPLTTDQVEELKATRPDWLQQERATQVAVKNELDRVKTAKPAPRRNSGPNRPATSPSAPFRSGGGGSGFVPGSPR